jgi:hypothetical protein
LYAFAIIIPKRRKVETKTQEAKGLQVEETREKIFFCFRPKHLILFIAESG